MIRAGFFLYIGHVYLLVFTAVTSVTVDRDRIFNVQSPNVIVVLGHGLRNGQTEAIANNFEGLRSLK